MSTLPTFVRVRQKFPKRSGVQIDSAIDTAYRTLSHSIRPGDRVAVGVGSRGISHIAEIIAAVIGRLKDQGAKPYIFPAMGSHGGATAAGQAEVLASYGIDESRMGVPIDARMDVQEIGETSEGIHVVCSAAALAGDKILLVNRIKPHTDFFGTIGSGIIKMSVVGLGKQVGASRFHIAALQMGYEPAILSIARHLRSHTKLVGGIAILEDESHSTVHVEGIPAEHLFEREPQLFEQAKQMMPCLPFDNIDLLIIDKIGKDISGAGMDPNITQRSIHGYSSLTIPPDDRKPFVRRIFVRGLTPDTHGNAVGIGLADATTERLVRETDFQKTIRNSLTSLTTHSAKTPIPFPSDQIAIDSMLGTLPLDSPETAKIARIESTLALNEFEISTPLWESCSRRDSLEIIAPPHPLRFDDSGNIIESTC